MLYEYPGLRNRSSKCDLEILRRGQTTLVICSELVDNPGTSVTNFAEGLATLVCQADATIDPCHLIWIEHYPEREAGRWQKPFPETWDLVTFQERTGRVFRGPHWRRVSAGAMAALRRAVEG